MSGESEGIGSQHGDVYRKSKAVYRHRWTCAGIAAADDPADQGGGKEQKVFPQRRPEHPDHLSGYRRVMDRPLEPTVIQPHDVPSIGYRPDLGIAAQWARSNMDQAAIHCLIHVAVGGSHGRGTNPPSADAAFTAVRARGFFRSGMSGGACRGICGLSKGEEGNCRSPSGETEPMERGGVYKNCTKRKLE